MHSKKIRTVIWALLITAILSALITGCGKEAKIEKLTQEKSRCSSEMNQTAVRVTNLEKDIAKKQEAKRKIEGYLEEARILENERLPLQRELEGVRRQAVTIIAQNPVTASALNLSTRDMALLGRGSPITDGVRASSQVFDLLANVYYISKLKELEKRANELYSEIYVIESKQSTLEKRIGELRAFLKIDEVAANKEIAFAKNHIAELSKRINELDVKIEKAQKAWF